MKPFAEKGPQNWLIWPPVHGPRLPTVSNSWSRRPQTRRRTRFRVAVASAMLCVAAACLQGAVFHVDPGGDDMNPGTETQPWRTIHKAAASVRAGDLVLVNPGIYEGPACTVSSSGTMDAPITFRATGPVTNMFLWDLDKQYVVVDGFVHVGHGFARIRTTASNIILTNCEFKHAARAVSVFLDSPRTGEPPERAASFCKVVNCIFDTLTNLAVINLQGVGHLVESNVIRNLYSCDAFRLFGSNVVIRGNIISNVVVHPGVSNHPDIIQTFGDNGFWMVDYVFERNMVYNSPVQLFQAGMTKVADPAKWGIVFRNNLFVGGSMQCSIVIPNVHFYNNTFYRCSNGGDLLTFTFYDASAPGWRGEAYGGRVVNNAFVECSGSYVTVYAGPAQGELGPLEGGAEGRLGRGYAWLTAKGGIIRVWGEYSGLSGRAVSGSIYIVDGGDLYTMPITEDGRFINEVTITDGAGGYSVATQWGAINAYRLGLRLNTTKFPNGEIGGRLLRWTPDPAPELVADFNFRSGNNGAPMAGGEETHGINGGNPGLVAPLDGDFRLRGDSVLRGKGTPVQGLDVDIMGTRRPHVPSIGAFEWWGDSQPAAPQRLRVASDGG